MIIQYNLHEESCNTFPRGKVLVVAPSTQKSWCVAGKSLNSLTKKKDDDVM